MKFGAEWKHKVDVFLDKTATGIVSDSLQPLLQKRIVNYKNWKKASRAHVRSEKALDEKEVISRLTFELSQVERVYVASMHALATSKCKDSSQVSLFFAKLLCAAIIGKNDAHTAYAKRTGPSHP